MKFILLFSFSLSIISSTLFAQTQTTTSEKSCSVKGRIIDKESNVPVPLAQVIIENKNRGTSSDMNGNFVIKNIPAGTYDLRIAAVGYEDFKISITLTTGQELNLDSVKISTGVVMLEEVVVAASVIKLGEERQTPSAVSTITARDIQEQMGSTEFPEVLKSTPGIYTSMAGGSLGSGRVTVRGFSSENTAVMLNGIPVNDMENGRVFWSNWGGLNDVTRYKQIQRGLGNSRLAISSVGGTINILSKPTEMKKGIGASYAITNSSYRNKLMITASTGLIKNWAITVSGSRRWGSGYRPGTNTDSWAYYAAIYKKIGEKHQFLFTGFGAPQKTGTGYSSTQKEYEKYGYLYNKAWGYQDGEERNRSVNQFHKPQFMLSHYFDINKKMKLTTNAYISIGRGGQTNIQRSVGSSSLNSSYLYDENGQLNWDTIVSLNQSNLDVSQTHLGQVSGARSMYYLEQRHNNHNWYGILTSLKTDLTERLSVSFGIDARLYKGQHYATVEDMLGGKYFLDQDQFKSDADFNTFIPNRAVTRGDTVRYNYSSSVNWLGLFSQVDYTIGNFDFFLTANASKTSFYRDGKFNPSPYDTIAGAGGYGKSETLSFENYTTKGGVNYRITGRHNVFVNAGYFNRAPFFTNAFVNPLVSNQVIDNLKNEQMSSVEAGYGYHSGKFTINFNVYYTKRTNFATTESYLLNGTDFVDVLTSDIDAIHKGIEVDVKIKPTRKLEVSGMLSLGDWKWSDNAVATVRNNNTLEVIQSNQVIYIKDLPIGNSAQTVGALRSRYQLPFFSYVGIGWNYFDRLYMDYSPSYRTDSTNTAPLLLKSFYTFDIFAGKSWRIKKYNHSVRLVFNVNNLLNTQMVVEGNENPSGDNYFQTGRPAIYNLQLTYEF